MIRMNPGKSGINRHSDPLPRRVVDPEARAPIVLGRISQHHPNHALRLPGTADQARVLRGRLAAVLPDSLADTALTLASELFNNAVAHSRSGEAGGEVTVVVNRFPGRVQIKVIDQGPRDAGASSPHLRPVVPVVPVGVVVPGGTGETGGVGEPGAVGGWGLRMVATESSRWGTLHDGGRTTVWFELDRPRTRS
ncbi:ATP-binding protein [Nocardiopsis dassonvillei subsp. albirubida]|uniref:ATP-binding protein n=2 Tax=Nocardiopsis alborubida TaxID=146802 RepID=A0A7X6RQH9_9ACTN|nr:ATP-binding protein [Nocardiopsis alborubida]